jgi:hypothetical protein
MSNGELRRVEALERVKSKHLKRSDAAGLLRVSYRQAKRLYKRYREEEVAGLKHPSAERPLPGRRTTWFSRSQASR